MFISFNKIRIFARIKKDGWYYEWHTAAISGREINYDPFFH